MSREVDEKLLARVWRGQWLDPSRLRTVEGERVQVVFPGRGNGDSGPDIVGAVVALEDGRLLQGAMELHVSARDWEAHRHHRDPSFNSVVLHVTWKGDLPWVEREDGVRIPTLPLNGCTLIPIRALMGMDEPELPFFKGCREVAEGLGPGRVGELLDRMGEERFKGKGACFQGELACRPAEEVLYQGLLRALGYSKNQEPFLRLAQHLPFSALRGLAGGMPDSRRPLAIAASLLGVAGLLPSQGAQDWSTLARKEMNVLEESWRASRLNREMEAREWRTFRIRPANHPGNRIIGAGHFISRFVGIGLVEGLEEVLWSASAEDQGPLERGLVVPRYLGRERTREMVANVVLPFFWGLGEYGSLPSYAEASLGVFRALPRGQDNRITRQMGAQLFRDGGRGIVVSARRQQGLIHLFKGPCQYGYCSGCPLGLACGGGAAKGSMTAAG